MKSIKSKLFIVSFLFLLVPSLILGTISYTSAKNGLDEAGEQSIKNAVTQALQLINALNEQVEAGSLPLEDAQEQVKVYLLGEMDSEGKRPINKDIDLGENGYFVIYDEKGLEVAHPSIEGQNMWDAQDKEGKLLVQEQIATAVNGGGFTTYSWNYPNNENKIGQKIMYNAFDENWGWIVTAGSYMDDFNESSNSILWTVLFTVIGSLLVGTILIYLFANHISKPIQAVNKQLAELSENNMTVENLSFKRKDEIGQLASSLNRMKENLHQMIAQISNVSHALAASSEQLTASAEETNLATEQIAGSIQQISDNAIQETQMAKVSESTAQTMASNLETIQHHVEDVSKSANDSYVKVQRGKEEIQHSSDKMLEIQEKTTQAASAIHELGNKSNEIGNIVGLITDISTQTNLLALNAAIEAARAGEHGKGFAVVADEVRKLAEESNRSAAQISQLVADIQVEIKQSVQTMAEGEEKVQEGIVSIERTGREFEQIETSTDEIVKIAKTVLDSVKDVNEGTEKMVKAVSDTTQMVLQSSAEAETVAAASEEQSASIQEVASASASLSKMAEELSGIVSKFKLH